MTKKAFWFPWLVCTLGALFYCYEYFLRITPSVMAPQLMHGFGIDAAIFGNLTAFYYYAYTPMQIPIGVMMDRFGPRRLLAIATLICILGSYLFAHGNLALAYVGRFMLGFGSAFAFVGVLKLASLWLPSNRFAMIAGLATALGMAGAIGGNFLLADFVEKIGWRETVSVSGYVGIILALAIWFIIPGEKETRELSPYAASVDRMTVKRLLQELLQLIKSPQIWLVGLIGCLLYLPISAFAELWDVPYLERVYGLANQTASHANSAIFFGWLVGGPIIGYISDKIKNRVLPITICSALAVVTIMVILFVPSVSQSHLLTLLFIFGIFTSAQVLVFAMAREIAGPNLAGTAVAFTNMVVMIGGMLSQPLIGWALDLLAVERHHLAKVDLTNLQTFTTQDFQTALLVLPVGIALSLLVTFLVKKTTNVNQIA